MAKKSRRRSRTTTAPRRHVPKAQPAPTQARPPVTPARAAPAQTTADIAGEYRHVVSDLRRIGILAASMFGLLIVIALVAQFAAR